MKTAAPLLVLALALTASAEIKRQERRSLLDSEPGAVYLEPVLGKNLALDVIKEAPVFSDTEGKHRLGTLKADQTVKLEAVTDRIYRVRGQGTHGGIAGWVAPWAFTSKDPQFVTHLKEFHERQIQVQQFIDAKQVAVGMTLDEVSQARGKPTKTTVRKTEKGESGKWEYIDYEQVKHYITRVDPSSGQYYRQLSHIEQVEKGRTNVEFGDGIVTAVEESVDRQGGNVRIVVPPLVFGW